MKTTAKNFDKVMNGVVLCLTYVAACLFLYVAWTGAKYLFEDIVHWGVVDTAIVAFTSYRFTLAVYKLDKKYGKKAEVANVE